MQQSEPAQQAFAVIDAGHGGKLPSGSTEKRTLSSPNNARSPFELLEKDLTLELALVVEQALRKEVPTNGSPSVRAVLTRRNDANPDFAERAEIAGNLQLSSLAVVSIHFNAMNGQEKGR